MGGGAVYLIQSQLVVVIETRATRQLREVESRGPHNTVIKTQSSKSSEHFSFSHPIENDNKTKKDSFSP